MRRRSLAAFVAALVAVALGLGASAATGTEPAPKGFEGAFELPGTHGYKLRGLIASTGKAGILILSVGKKGEGVEYFAHGEETKENVDFDLGSLGKFDFKVQPTGRSETVRPDCGKPVTVEGEEYVGTLEFHGEEEFTDAEATRTPLRLKPILDIVCPGGFASGETSGATIPGARLRVTERGGPTLQVNQNRPGGPVFYEAQITERRHEVSIHRTVGGHLGGGAFSFDPSLTDASFAAGAPFSGSATYLGAHPPRGTHPANGTWRGNLTVDFPGRADVPLAGPGFKAAIIHARRTESGR